MTEAPPEPAKPHGRKKTPRQLKPMGMWPATEKAVRKTMEREKAGLHADHAGVARECGISPKTLKTAMWRVRKGYAIFSLPGTVKEMEVSKGQELERTLKLVKELEHFYNDRLAGLIAQVKGTNAKKAALAADAIPEVLSNLKSLATLERAKEQGYMAILDKVNRERTLKAPLADIAAEVLKADPASASVMAAEALRADEEDGETEVAI